MSKADVSITPILARRTVLAGIASAQDTLPFDDGELLKFEKLIFEQHEQADAFNDEIWRLHKICVDEFMRLVNEASQGRCMLTEDEQWALVCEMPESKECTQLQQLQAPFGDRMDALIDRMWQIPARTA